MIFTVRYEKFVRKDLNKTQNINTQMNIKVRIVGIYFRAEVKVDKDATVWEVTKAAEAAEGGALRIKGDKSIETVEYDTDPPRSFSPTNVDRAKGTYVLAEDKTVRSRALVWQYYIQRPTRKVGGVQLYETISSDGTAKAAFTTKGLKNKDQIMWRLIAVGLDPAGEVSPPPAVPIA
jgi:hypothetical protein